MLSPQTNHLAMNALRICLIIFLVICHFELDAQDDKQARLIKIAFDYQAAGDYLSEIKTWDVILANVDSTQGKDCVDYFIGTLYKAKALIKIEKYFEAEEVLLSAMIPSTGLDIYTYLQFYESFGECLAKQGKLSDAFHMYKIAYDFLFEHKEYYQESSKNNVHWCWSDELCLLGLEMSRLLRQNEEYFNASEILCQTFNKIISQGKQNCYEHNRDGLFYVYFKELVEITEYVLKYCIGSNNLDDSLPIYDSIIQYCKYHPALIAILDYEPIIEYILSNTLKVNREKGIRYIEEYLALREAYIDYAYNNKGNDYILVRHFESVKIAHTYQDAEEYELAELYYLKGKRFLEENNMTNNQDYLLILSELSYLHELKYLSINKQ